MAVSAGFKQTCPSCDAVIPIRDPKLIGKKVDCPRCKFRFVIEGPAKADKTGDAEETSDTSEAIQDKALKTAVKKPSAKPSASAAAKSTAAKPNPAANGAAGAAAKSDDDEKKDTPKKQSSPMMKKLLASKKLLIGAGLAVVGLAVLVVAGFSIMGGGGKDPKQISQLPKDKAGKDNTARDKGEKNKVATDKVGADKVDKDKVAVGKDKADKDKIGKDKVGKDKVGKDKNGDKDKKDPDVKDNPDDPPVPEGVRLSAELTNLLPNDPEVKEPEHVAHYFFRNLFGPQDGPPGPLRDLARRAFPKGFFEDNLGFSLLDVDDLIRAERYSKPAWSFTVVHTRVPIEREALKKALGLETAGAPIKGQDYYRVVKGRDLLEQFGKVSLGAPERLRRLSPAAAGSPLLVRLHDRQTLIFADEAPMKAFLQVEGQFKLQSDRPESADARPADLGRGDEQFVVFQPQPPFGKDKPPFPKDKVPPPFGKDKVPPPFDKDKVPPPFGKDKKPPDKDKGKPKDEPKPLPGPKNAYLTIDPKLKAVLDKMETRYGVKEKVLISMATDLKAARLAADKGGPGRSLWQFRQLWDVTQLIEDREIRAQTVGLSLAQTGARAFRYRNEVRCPGEADARDLYGVLFEEGAPVVAHFIEAILSNPPDQLFTVQLPWSEKEKEVPPNPKDKDKKATKPKEEENASARIQVERKTIRVSFTVEMDLTTAEQARLTTVLATWAQGIRGEVDLRRQRAGLHGLGRAVKLLSEKGLAVPEAAKEKGLNFPTLAAGRFPPAVFSRGGAWALNREPSQRVSWMVGLLPYLGRQGLYDRINFSASWKDPSNWLAARALVPEFLDTTYPDQARYTRWPDVAIELGATHLVGVAGVGLDASDYPPGDPRQGVFGYERSATLAEIEAARGLPYTILLLQVPHDGEAGTTPWMAGGGATIRGVPDDKDPIKPFVLTTDRHGKDITRNGKPGTYAVMCDGSVRWIDAKIPADVFKALCTIRTALPPGFDPDNSALFELVPDPSAPPPKAGNKDDPKKAKG